MRATGTSEAPSADAAREAALTGVYRAAHIAQHGDAETLRQMLAQEAYALSHAGCTTPTLDADDLAYTRENLQAQRQSLDLSKRALADNEKRFGTKHNAAVRYWLRFMGADGIGDPDLAAISPARAGSIWRGLRFHRTKPTASAPSRTANSASAARVMPQILTRGRAEPVIGAPPVPRRLPPGAPGARNPDRFRS